MDCGLNQSNIGPVARGYDDKALGGYEPLRLLQTGTGAGLGTGVGRLEQQ